MQARKSDSGYKKSSGNGLKRFILPLFILVIMIMLGRARRSEPVSVQCEKLVKSYEQTGRFSGSVLIREKGEIVFQSSQDDHEVKSPAIYPVGELTGLFIRSAAVRLAEKGKLKWNDPVSAFVPDFPNGGQITIEHLMTNRSGLPNIYASDIRLTNPEFLDKNISKEHVLHRLKSLAPLSDPGSEQMFSSANSALLSFIIEKASETKLDTLLSRMICNTAGMKNTFFPESTREIISGYSGRPDSLVKVSDYYLAAFWGAKHAASSAEDIAFFAEWLGRSSSFDTFSRYCPVDRFGWMPGFRSALLYVPEYEITAVILSNRQNAPVEEMLLQIMTILIRGRVIPQDENKTEKIKGVYTVNPFENTAYTIRVEKSGSRLILSLPLDGEAYTEAELHPVSSNRYFASIAGQYLNVIIAFPETDGMNQTCMLYIGGWKLKGVRVSDLPEKDGFAE